MHHAVQQEFLNNTQWKLVQAADTVAELLPELVRAAGSTAAAPLNLI
jgi:hypothetical protein